MRVDDLKKYDFSETLCVGITSWSGDMINHALKLAKHVRSIDGSIPIIWGGAHPSLLPEQTCSPKDIDYIMDLIEKNIFQPIYQ